jgi:hypothetical protein
MAQDTKEPGGNKARDENAVKLLRVLFHDVFCPQNSVPDERKAEILPAYFYGWIDKHWTEFDQEELLAKAKVEADTWHFVRQLLEGDAVEATNGIWFAVVLAGRPAAPSEVASINVVCNITFKDGSIATTQGFVSHEMFTGPPLDDALAFMTLRTVMKQVITEAVKGGLVGLYEVAQKTKFTSDHPNDPFNVFMGWCLKHMVRGEPFQGRVDPKLVPALENYVRLAQQCIRPPVPPHVLAAFKARQQEQDGREAGKPRGGWAV